MSFRNPCMQTRKQSSINGHEGKPGCPCLIRLFADNGSGGVGFKDEELRLTHFLYTACPTSFLVYTTNMSPNCRANSF
ncbi:hypothetical protein SAMN05216348_104153 [Olsenella sp. KH3B4]|nr:hypothetical protein SAMN05216348_104153 [Olsenella sp. KH3B4]